MLLSIFNCTFSIPWIRETRRKITCSFCTVLFWDLTYNRRIIVYHTLKILISHWEGYRISSPIGWRNSRVISLENPNSDWTIPHNSAISRGIYEQRKDEIENGFLLSFTDSGRKILIFLIGKYNLVIKTSTISSSFSSITFSLVILPSCVFSFVCPLFSLYL